MNQCVPTSPVAPLFSIDEATLNKGKRRTGETRDSIGCCPTASRLSTTHVSPTPRRPPPLSVTYLAFMCLVLLAAACDDEEWVKGGFQYNNRRRALSPTGALDGADAALFGEPETSALAGSADANLGAPIPANTRYFAIGLSKAEQSGNWYAPNSGKTLQRVCSSNIKSYIATWNAGTVQNPNPNGWNSPQVGAKPIKVDTFTDTLGLMGFATAVQVWGGQGGVSGRSAVDTATPRRRLCAGHRLAAHGRRPVRRARREHAQGDGRRRPPRPLRLALLRLPRCRRLRVV